MRPPRYLLDTNIASFAMRNRSAALLARLAAANSTQLCLSAISLAELQYGLARRPEATTLHELVAVFVTRVTLLVWNADAAVAYGNLRAQLEASGMPMGNLDLMIAAHSLASGCVLVTNDRAFKRVPNLAIEDWTKA